MRRRTRHGWQGRCLTSACGTLLASNGLRKPPLQGHRPHPMPHEGPTSIRLGGPCKLRHASEETRSGERKRPAAASAGGVAAMNSHKAPPMAPLDCPSRRKCELDPLAGFGLRQQSLEAVRDPHDPRQRLEAARDPRPNPAHMRGSHSRPCALASAPPTHASSPASARSSRWPGSGPRRGRATASRPASGPRSSASGGS